MQPPALIRAVIFDYGGVLTDSPFEGIERWERRMGYPPGSVRKALLGDYGTTGGEDPLGLHKVETGELSLAQFLANVAERSPQVMGGEVFDAESYTKFLAGPPMGIRWMVVGLVRRLRAEGYRIGMITNNVREWGATWRRTIPMDLFDDVVDSCEVGVRKPDPRIYHLACERLGVEPAEALFLDDLAANVEAAVAVGMAGIVVDDPWRAIDELDALLAERGLQARAS